MDLYYHFQAFISKRTNARLSVKLGITFDFTPSDLWTAMCTNPACYTSPMIHTQLVTPNLDPIVTENGKVLTDWFGMCAATVRSAFNAPVAGLTAWQNWESYTHFKHADRDWPVGVYFPIYFSGYNGEGHEAIAFVNSTGSMNIWTSPWQHNHPFFDNYVSVDVLAKAYGNLTYVGWSEDVNGMRVIEAVTAPAPAPAAPAPAAHPAMPAIGSEIQLLPTQIRDTFHAGTVNEAGKINVVNDQYVYTVRGYDSVYPNRVIINSASGGGNGVALALYYTNGANIGGWKTV